MDRHRSAGEAVAELSRIMARLRAPDGCPWYREQSLETLKGYLLEECYELIDAIDSGDRDEHVEELGDVLLQVVFQAQIRAEEDAFGLAEVAKAISDKLLRRHPHVFGDKKANDSAEVHANWESIKAQERKDKPTKKQGRLAGVPKAMPGLLRAYRIGQKASSAGFDWPDARGAWDKLEEELAEFSEAMGQNDPEHLREELGDVLFAVCNVARHAGLDPEDAIRGANEKFQRRFEVIEQELDRAGERFEESSLDRLEGLWELAKSQEH
ncbi:MAG: nucleoside triphosphate pyrophosphohydrolase [Myxococcota bacterium]